MEIKQLNIQDAAIKIDANGGLKFSGYASVFNGVDSYGDTIKKGAYQKTISDRSRPIQLRWNHHGPVIGKWLDLKEDDTGLLVEGELTKGHSIAEDTAALLKHGAISGMSIGYYDIDSEKNEKGGRDLKQIELVEISIVETPADNSAHVQDLKSAESLKDIERVLRQKHSLSQSEATAIVASTKRLCGDRKESKEAESLEILNQFNKKLGEKLCQI